MFGILFLVPVDPATIDKSLAAGVCETLAEQRLKSPGTADHPFGNGQKVTSKGKQRYFLRSCVDAQNVLGATLRTNYHWYN